MFKPGISPIRSRSPIQPTATHGVYVYLCVYARVWVCVRAQVRLRATVGIYKSPTSSENQKRSEC